MILLICLGLLSSMSISWTLWAGERIFPKFPVFQSVPQFDDSLSQIVTLGFFGFLLLLALNPTRLTAAITISIMFVFALQDQMRWQPWFYQYLLMLIPIAVAKSGDSADEKSTLAIYRIIIVSIYLWSGLHKCHAGFLSVHEGMVKPLTDAIDSPFLVSAINWFGYAIPPIEILMAIGLVFRRTRRLSVYVVIVTHIAILILLGPVKGELSNPVVWPWNFVMAAMTITLFGKVDTIDLLALKKSKLTPIALITASLTLLAPALFHTGHWDRYLSFNLYGGWQKRMLVKISQDDIPKLQTEWLSYCVESNALDQHLLLSPSQWSSQELKAPFVSEWRILRQFSQNLCELGIGQNGAFIYIDYRHLPEKPKRYFTCQQIEEMRE